MCSERLGGEAQGTQEPGPASVSLPWAMGRTPTCPKTPGSRCHSVREPHIAASGALGGTLSDQLKLQNTSQRPLPLSVGAPAGRSPVAVRQRVRSRMSGPGHLSTHRAAVPLDRLAAAPPASCCFSQTLGCCVRCFLCLNTLHLAENYSPCGVHPVGTPAPLPAPRPARPFSLRFPAPSPSLQPFTQLKMPNHCRPHQALGATGPEPTPAWPCSVNVLDR